MTLKVMHTAAEAFPPPLAVCKPCCQHTPAGPMHVHGNVARACQELCFATQVSFNAHAVTLVCPLACLVCWMQKPEVQKRPANAYNLFFKEQYSQVAVGGLKVTDAAKEIAARWKSLPEAEKARYKATADEAMRAYKASQGL